MLTTTWKEWKKRHPQTRLLSLGTGHARDYCEGAAHCDCFATDKVRFGVPKLDSRLANKAEVPALRFADAPGEPVAIAADFLLKNPAGGACNPDDAAPPPRSRPFPHRAPP